MTRTLSVVVAAAALMLDLASAQTPSRGPAPARETFADLPGVRIWFRDTGGSGVPVVFMHSATGSSRNWDNQFAVFTAAGYRCIAYDRRGWGRSVIDPAGPQPGTAPDDLQALMNSLGVDRFHLVGTAAGGFVSLDYAVSFSPRLRSLVVSNGLGGIQDEDYLELGRRLRPAAFNALPPDVRELGPSYRAANPEGTRQWLEMERLSRPEAARGPAQTQRNNMTYALLEKITAPTLLITGDADMYTPPPLLPLFKARIKNSESLMVPEAGHSAYWEQPEFFNRSVLDFIRRH